MFEKTALSKGRFKEKLKKRIPARWHMSVICLATLGAGILISKLILYFELAGPALRYGSAVVFSYGVFFLLVYLWLRYYFNFQKPPRSKNDSVDAVDFLDVPVDLHHPAPAWSGSGGQFSGGGASESWGASSPDFSVGDAEGAAAVVVVFVVGAVLMVVFGSAVYVIYQAPEILFEAAFEALLVAGLLKEANRMQQDGWSYSIFKNTCIPFMIVFLMATGFGFFIQKQCPTANSFSQFRKICWEQ